MAKQHSKRTQVVEDVVMVFRDKGYEGASLSDLAQATGLGRASLYHHFPGGKEDMGRAAMAQAGQKFAKLVISPLSESGTPAQRWNAMVDGISRFYKEGPLACLTNTMTMGEGQALFRETIAQSLLALQHRAAALLKEAGVEDRVAEESAEDAVITLHGALVIGRVEADTAVFDRAMSRLKARFEEYVA